MKRVILLCSFLAYSATLLFAQQAITLEDIWQNYSVFARSVAGFDFLNDGKSYTRLEEGKVQQYDFTSGNFTKTVFDLDNIKEKDLLKGGLDSYSFSEDESKMLLSSGTESIYRHSSRENTFVWNLKTKQLTPVFDRGKQMYATFSPAGDKVAFVHDNNLYYKDLKSDKVIQITKDGKYNHIINGASDWVYEEEFALVRAFEWSPDGKKIAFLRFDESAVKEFTMQMYKDELYPEHITFKYPKVGETNSKVSAHIYNLTSRKTTTVETGSAEDIYLPRIRWTEDPNTLCVFRMNRHQNQLELLLANASNGKSTLLHKEVEDEYVSENLLDDIKFLKNAKEFVMTSERDGWKHIYLYDMKGKMKRQLTKGNWEVTSFYGVDEEEGTIYYQAAKESPMRRHIYRADLKGKKEMQLSKKAGSNRAEFSSTFDYFVLTHSTINSAPTYAVYTDEGKLQRELEDNARLAKLQKNYGTTPVEFFDFKTNEDVELNGWMIKPADFDESKEYPVFMYLYGGPGSQQVTDGWKSANYWWFQMLAQKGFIVACVDNRGTGGRGEAFKKVTYQQLGHYETIDQIEAAKYLGSLPYTDKDRIGIFGWSYGGYMSSLCLLKGNDVFKAAIAVAPVTSWKWYDTIYTERFMRTLKENPKGYEDNSPIYFADRLKGNYLLVHGMGDDNVHFQHAVEMANALVMANKQFDTYYYPNRNHGIYGGPTRLHLYTKMTNFLMRDLMGDDSPVGKD